MSTFSQQQEERRKLLTILGGSAVALPFVGLAGCGGGEEAGSSSSAPANLASNAGDAMEKAASDTAEAASDAMDSMSEQADSAMQSAEETMDEAMDSAEEAADEAMTIASDAAGDMPRVDENGAQAKGLGYRHDATTIDSSAQPRYAAGQQCSNCALYQGGDAEWGACPLFAGQQVKATGWCNAYAAKA